MELTLHLRPRWGRGYRESLFSDSTAPLYTGNLWKSDGNLKQSKSSAMTKSTPSLLNALNRVWLEQHNLLEDGDLKHLQHPEESILAPGGEIFFAVRADQVVGTCAVIPRQPGEVELIKLTVTDQVRGQGIGRRLTEHAIDWARRRGAAKVVLVSATPLKDALRLYERLGFTYGPMPADTGYETADIYMELAL